MKQGIIAIVEDIPRSYENRSSFFRFWLLKNGKINPDYAYYPSLQLLHPLTFGEAKCQLEDKGILEYFTLVTPEQFQNEVKRRKDIRKNEFVWHGDVV